MKSLMGLVAVAVALVLASGAEAGCRKVQNVIVQEVVPAPTYVAPTAAQLQAMYALQAQLRAQQLQAQLDAHLRAQQLQAQQLNANAYYSRGQAFSAPRERVIVQRDNGSGRQNLGGGGGGFGNFVNGIFSPQGLLTIGGAAGGAAIAGPGGAVAGSAIGGALGAGLAGVLTGGR